MIPIDFKNKVALVTGVGDNDSFAWYIAKALQAAGAKVVLACHPRVVGIQQADPFRVRDAHSDVTCGSRAVARRAKQSDTGVRYLLDACGASVG